jgi:RND family efflux transporter MFP subunit
LPLLSSCGSRRERADEKKIKVETAVPQSLKFRDTIRSYGNVEPKDHVKICARTEGVIDEMKVDEGDYVTKGQLLSQLDKMHLESLIEVEQQNLNLAATRVKEAQGWLDISKAENHKAGVDFERSKKLTESNIETKDAFEKKQLLYTKSQLQIELSGAGLKLAEAHQKQAESNLTIAHKKYNDSLIRAPYNAVVTHQYFQQGEYAKMGDGILRLENPERLEISILLSSVYYPRLKPGLTPALIYGEKGEKITEVPVSYRAPYIDPQSRTFEIKIDLPPGQGFVSGMLCEVELVLEERQGFGVPQDAIIPRDGGEVVVFTVKDGKAAAVKVRTGIEDQGYVELLNLPHPDRTPVVVSGQNFLNDGIAVEVRHAGKEASHVLK